MKGVVSLNISLATDTFGQRVYYESTVGLNTETIQKYIREQGKKDQLMDKLKTKEYTDPFKGSK